MSPVVMALIAMVSPGFAHGLMSQRRAMFVVIGAMAVCGIAMAFTVWAMWLFFAVYLGSVVHAGFTFRKLAPRVRYSWLDPIIAFALTLMLSIGLRGFVVEAFRIPASSGYPNLQIDDHVFADKLSLLWHAPERGEIVVFRQPCEERDYVKRVVAVAGDTVEIRCSVVYVNGKALPTALVQASETYEDVFFGGQESRTEMVTVSRYHESNSGHEYDLFFDAERPARDAQRTDASDHADFPDDELHNCANPTMGQRPIHSKDQLPGKLVVTGEPGTCTQFRHYVVPEGHLFMLGDNRDNSNDSRFWGPVPVSYVKGRVRGIWMPFSRFGGID